MAFNLEPTASSYNSTQVSWMNESNERGTLSILTSCISSLFLSTWAVMHLNIPRKHSSKSRCLATYFYWCIFGVIGPELVIWVAWRQLMSAWALRDEMRVHFKDWTITHGFFALMGGFVIDLDKPPFEGLPPFTTSIRRLTLTPKGILLLAKCGRLHNVRREDIMDKSKVDELGKLLACTQATWVIVQVCTRLALHLPVTTLEVTTVSHTICAIVLYALWWHKPRKIGEPTLLQGAWTRNLAAFMLMCSRESQDDMLPGFQLNGQLSEIAGLELFARQEPKSDVSTVGDFGTDDDRPKLYDFRRKYSASVTDTKAMPVHHVRPAADSGVVLAKQAYGISVAPSGINRSGDVAEPINATTKIRWDLAKEAIAEYEAVQQLLRAPHDEADIKFHLALATYPEMPQHCRPTVRGLIPQNTRSQAWMECDTQHLVTTIASNWPHDGLLRTTSGLWVGAFLWLTSIAFSAVHIAAWYAAFPTKLEAWLWRTSSIYIAFSGLLWALLHVLAEYSARFWWTWYDIMIGEAPAWLMISTSIVCGICGTMYILCRAYLITEAFVSLRWLPVAAYLVPEWTLGVPHVA